MKLKKILEKAKKELFKKLNETINKRRLNKIKKIQKDLLIIAITKIFLKRSKNGFEEIMDYLKNILYKNKIEAILKVSNKVYENGFRKHFYLLLDNIKQKRKFNQTKLLTPQFIIKLDNILTNKRRNMAFYFILIFSVSNYII